jgi:DNA-binding transcriptional MerR regulator
MAIEGYSIQDLSDQTGLPRRTIHFYTQQGLLPAPEGAGLGARYGEEHLLRLKLIPQLQAQGLRLDTIRERLQALDLDALRGMMTTAAAPLSSRRAPASTPQTYTHYPLPGGITITAPAGLKPAERKKLLDLIAAAREIFDLPGDQEKAQD